eukprot:XP_001701014.1 amine oxidase family protein [Chlamydomonas reinhardtii]
MDAAELQPGAVAEEAVAAVWAATVTGEALRPPAATELAADDFLEALLADTPQTSGMGLADAAMGEARGEAGAAPPLAAIGEALAGVLEPGAGTGVSEDQLEEDVATAVRNFLLALWRVNVRRHLSMDTARSAVAGPFQSRPRLSTPRQSLSSGRDWRAGGLAGVAELGGSIVTGCDGNPLAVLALQGGIPAHRIADATPLYWDDGRPVDEDFDRADDAYELLGEHAFLAGGNGRLAGDVVFDPPLPAAKQEAIQRLGYGRLNKVALLFPRVFWDPAVDTFAVAVREPERRGAYYLFYCGHHTGGAPVLTALVAGAAAVAIEALSDRQALVTRWGSDPYSRGSYSSMGLSCRGAAEYAAMAAPEDGSSALGYAIGGSGDGGAAPSAPPTGPALSHVRRMQADLAEGSC